VEEEDNAHTDTDDSSVDSDLYDSDFMATEDDDDMFAKNIDKSVMDYNEKELCEENEDEEALEDDDLNIGEGDKEVLKERIKPFNAEVDMDIPLFHDL
jgi:hypothetical protein